MPALLVAQQIARAADVEVMRRQREPGAQLVSVCITDSRFSAAADNFCCDGHVR